MGPANPGAFCCHGSADCRAARTSGVISQITPVGVASQFANLGTGIYPDGLAFDAVGNLYAAGQAEIELITTGGAVSVCASDSNSPDYLAFNEPLPVPEPATWLGGALLFCGAGLGGGRRVTTGARQQEGAEQDNDDEAAFHQAKVITAEATSSVMLRNKAGKLEYAD